MTLVVDEAYLNAPERVYPVIIDPGLNVGASGIEDATIYSNYRVNDGLSGSISVGNYSVRNGGTRGIARTLVKFPGLFSNSTFKSLSAGQITSVKFYVRDLMCESDSVWIDCYRATSYWAEIGIKYNTTIWNSYTDFQGDALVYYNNGTAGYNSTASGHWYGFNITQAVKGWKSGSYGNYGIMLKAYNESNGSRTFAAADRGGSYTPVVVVDYGVPVSQVCLSSTHKEMEVNDTAYLYASVVPSNANQSVYFTSSNSNVVSVGYTSGLLCAKGAGTATITVRSAADSSKYATCTVKVQARLTDQQLSEQIVFCFSLLTEYSSYAYLTPMQYAVAKGLDSEEAAIAEQTELVHSIQLVNYILLENKLVANSPTASSTIAKHILSGEKYDLFEQADITADIRNHSTVFDEVWRERNKQSWLELAQHLLYAGTMVPYVQIPASLVLLGQGIVGKDFTGRQLAWWERALDITSGVIGTIEGVGFISSAIKNSSNIKILDKLDDIARRTGDHAASEIAFAIRNGKITGRVLNGTLDAALINKVKNFRGSFIDNLANEGNVAFADVNISGLKTDWFAHSRIDAFSDMKPAGAVSNISLKPTTPVFTASEVGNYMRDVDTEYKILSDIAKTLGNNTSAVGKIKLFTERPPCDSCTRVIQQFSSKYKNIVIEVVDNGHKILKP